MGPVAEVADTGLADWLTESGPSPVVHIVDDNVFCYGFVLKVVWNGVLQVLLLCEFY